MMPRGYSVDCNNFDAWEPVSLGKLTAAQFQAQSSDYARHTLHFCPDSFLLALDFEVQHAQNVCRKEASPAFNLSSGVESIIQCGVVE